MKYKQLISQICDLHWRSAKVADLLGLMVLNAYAAQEFAESLRIALKVYSQNSAFQEIALGELETNNLEFLDYTGHNDHANFLWHFIKKYNVLEKCGDDIVNSGERYLQQVRKLDDSIRIMSVIAREQGAPRVFSSILEANGWNELPELIAFKYYLEIHIALDSGDGGHGDLLSKFKVDDSLSAFYMIRLDSLRALPVLFEI